MNTTTQTTDTTDEQLAREMLDVAEATTENGIRAQVTAVYEERGDVRVDVDLPSGETTTLSFEKPSRASTEYNFVNFLHTNGYRLSNFTEHLVGETVELEKVDGRWTPVVEEPTPPFTRRVKKWADERFNDLVGTEPLVTIIVIVLWPFLGYRAVYDPDNEYSHFDDFLGWLLILAFWVMIVFLCVFSYVRVVL